MMGSEGKATTISCLATSIQMILLVNAEGEWDSRLDKAAVLLRDVLIDQLGKM